jgi:hypothetical protein
MFHSHRCQGVEADVYFAIHVQRNRPDGEKVVPAGSGDFDRAFNMLLTLDLAENRGPDPKFCLGPIVARTPPVPSKRSSSVVFPGRENRGIATPPGNKV